MRLDTIFSNSSKYRTRYMYMYISTITMHMCMLDQCYYINTVTTTPKIVTVPRISRERIDLSVPSQTDPSVLHFSQGTCQQCARYPLPGGRKSLSSHRLLTHTTHTHTHTHTHTYTHTHTHCTSMRGSVKLVVGLILTNPCFLSCGN